MAQIFDTEKRAADYAHDMNSRSKKFKYYVLKYPKDCGGNDKKVVVVKRPKGTKPPKIYC